MGLTGFEAIALLLAIVAAFIIEDGIKHKLNRVPAMVASLVLLLTAAFILVAAG